MSFCARFRVSHVPIERGCEEAPRQNPYRSRSGNRSSGWSGGLALTLLAQNLKPKTKTKGQNVKTNTTQAPAVALNELLAFRPDRERKVYAIAFGPDERHLWCFREFHHLSSANEFVQLLQKHDFCYRRDIYEN